MADQAGPGGDDPQQTEIRTFLIADVRGYTLFTQERGDEAAAKLARKFAELAREGVEGRGGQVTELRGDEALCVFVSPRQAIRAAVDLQQRFVDETLDDPSLPLLVGIGLDAGEAVPVEGGYRGGALNMAARLCGQAGPGEILATPEVVHLARAVEGIRYADRGELHLKGIAQPVRVTRVIPEDRDPSVALAPHVAARAAAIPRARRLPSWKWIAAAIAVVVAVAVIVPLTLSGGGSGAALDSIAPNSVGIVDLKTNRIVDQVAVGARPTAIASGLGAVWVTDSGDGTVARIDPRTHAVQKISVGQEPSGIAVGFGSVWVADSGERTVSQINPRSGTVVNTITVGNGPLGIATGQGSVWVTNSTDGTISRIDPTSGSVGRPIGVGRTPSSIAVGAQVWVANAGDGTVSELDANTGRLIRTVAVGSDPRAVAVTKDGVWVAKALDGTVSRIDPTTGSIAETVPVGDGPEGLASTADGVWVTDEFGSSISLVTRGSGNAETIGVGNAPQAAAVVGSALWVIATGSGPGHRGGTISVESTTTFDSLDPARAYLPQSWSVVTMTNDGLVAFEKVGGPAGSTIVPDLAVAIPTPTDGGKTYTFQLRPGIRYSTGRVVRASDFRRAIERDFRVRSPAVQQAQSYYSRIVGARSCSRQACDLSRGIAADDRTGTVTVHLVAPDADFLAKLALSYADVVPLGTPNHGVNTSGLPATGPYMIQSDRPAHGSDTGRLVLVRNPRFHEWSAAAQPAGYPDRIVWRDGVPAHAGVTSLEQGRIDWYDDDAPPDSMNELRRQYADQVHTSASQGTYGYVLNTRLAPFDDVRVRRAIDYAVDRRTTTALWGQAAVTCQTLPANTVGYEPYCPYTIDPNAEGTWTAPDLAKARALIRSAHAAGESVTVWSSSSPDLGRFPPLGTYLAGLLRRLGFHVGMRIARTPTAFFEDVAQARFHAQAFLYGWFTDYPSAADFFQPLFTCASYDPTSPFNVNTAGFCDPSVDRMIHRALRLQSSDQHGAGQEWAAVDRAVADAAPWVPLFNPTGTDLISRRVKNYEHSLQWGLLVDQLWVK